jgi:hypothetical protein
MARAVLEMKNETLKEAIEMIRAAGFKRRAIRTRRWKTYWVDRYGRHRRLVMPVTPSDWRASLNSRAMLRRLLRP